MDLTTQDNLSPQRVLTAYKACLFNDGEDTSNHIPVEGIMFSVGFHPGRLKMRTPEIAAMLRELPDEFKVDQGGGMSFLDACMDRNGRLWTGDHATMDKLFQMGVAVGIAKCLLPREMWEALPGGMPYYSVCFDTQEN